MWSRRKNLVERIIIKADILIQILSSYNMLSLSYAKEQGIWRTCESWISLTRISVQVVNRLDSCHWKPITTNQGVRYGDWSEIRRKWVIEEKDQCSIILSLRKDRTHVEEADDKVLSYVATHFTSNLNFIPSNLCSISVLWNQYKKKKN